MATSIYFNGRRIVDPSAVSQIDASALQSVGPSATGIVALLGTAEGGEPLTVAVEKDATRPEKIRQLFRSGDLKTAALFAFEPSQDEAIPGGAQRVIPVKINPATQSVGTLVDALSAPSVDLTSRDYGQFTEQYSVEIDDGTNLGKQVVITFEGTVETFDDVGGEPVLGVLYEPGVEGYDAVTGRITATEFVAAATKAVAGLDAERTADIPAPGSVRIASSDASDTSQLVTVYGLNGANEPVSEPITLNGTTSVDSTASFAKVLGVVKSAATAGTITVSDTDAPTTLFTLAPATLTRGVLLTTNTPVAGAVTVSIDVNTPADVALFGTTSSGSAVAERFDMAAAATTPVVGSKAFGALAVIALGDLAAARTVTLTTNAVAASNSVFSTVRRLADRLNVLDGFTADALAPDAASLLVADADHAPAVSLMGAPGEFYADLRAVITAINQGSQFLSAARAVGASLVPANTASPVYLAGGSEGTPTITQWQQGFRLLKGRRVNTIVPLTRDPAVHALLLAHLIERAGPLRSEANGYIGVATSEGRSDTLSNIRSAITQINSRHVSAIVQEVQRFGVDDGIATWFAPHFLAALAAGMQAGSAIGEPLTKKIIFALDIRQNVGWTVEDDKDTLIDSGAMLAEKVDGRGIRWVRSITTHLQNNNLVFTEMSANESANQAVYDLRNALDEKIGDRALASSVGVIKGLATDALGRLKTDEIIADWKPRTLTVEQIADVFPVSVEIAPVVPINFIPITVHLVPLRVAA